MVKFSVELVDLIYPVGSIYISTNNTNPSLLFGGNWQQIKDKFLLSCGDTYNNGATGGSATVSLTKSQMPRHTHTQNSHNHTQNEHNHMSQSGRAFVTQSNSYTSNIGENAVASGSSYRVPTINPNDNWYGSEYTRNATATNQSQTATNQYTGGTNTTQAEQNGSAHENMPPYLAVYVWERIADEE